MLSRKIIKADDQRPVVDHPALEACMLNNGVMTCCRVGAE